MSIVTPSPNKSYRKTEHTLRTLDALNLRPPRYQDKTETPIHSRVRHSLEEILSRKLYTSLLPSISSSQDPLDPEESLQSQLQSLIAVEVKKMLNATHFVSQQQLTDLESKIKHELYIKEKKIAILQDRREQNNDDAVSHLSRVQNKLKDHKSYQSSLCSKQDIQQRLQEVQSVVQEPVLEVIDEDRDDWYDVQQVQQLQQLEALEMKQQRQEEARLLWRQELDRQQQELEMRRRQKQEEHELYMQQVRDQLEQVRQQTKEQEAVQQLKVKELNETRFQLASERKAKMDGEQRMLKREAQEYNEFCQREIEKEQELKRVGKQKQKGVMKMILDEADKVRQRKVEEGERQKEQDMRDNEAYKQRLEAEERKREDEKRLRRERGEQRGQNFVNEVLKKEREQRERQDRLVQEYVERMNTKAAEKQAKDKQLRQSLKSDLISTIEKQLGELSLSRMASREQEQKFAKTLLLGVEKEKREREEREQQERDKKEEYRLFLIRQHQEKLKRQKTTCMNSYEQGINKKLLDEAREKQARFDEIHVKTSAHKVTKLY